MQKIDNYNFKNKKVIVRVDFNVPLNAQYQITDDNRIQAALPTIKKLLAENAAVILMSHLGRPKGQEEKFSLKHLVPHLTEKTGVEVKFAPDCIGDETLKIKNELQPGEVLLLENLRFHKEEKKGDKDFARHLAEGVDVYVNDAFGTAHRAHASTTIIADFFPNDKMFGYVIENELISIDKVLSDPQKPYTAIMGGAKISDKIPIIENLLEKIDNLIIGGGMVYTFIKAQGGKIGNSLVENDQLELVLQLMEKAKANNVTIYLPTDNVVADKFDNDANRKTCKVNEIDDGWMGLDIGDQTIATYTEVIQKSATILWNGPMGVFEMENFQHGTKKIALAIADATEKGAFSLVGGGDSVAAVGKFALKNKVSYVSTGGGALLEYMEGKELPGIKAIRGE